MKWYARSAGRSRYLCLLALFALLALGQGEARADEVHIAGYTNGCFNCPSPPNTSATQGDSLFGLTYTNSTFSGTTAAGFRGLGGNPTAPESRASTTSAPSRSSARRRPTTATRLRYA